MTYHFSEQELRFLLEKQSKHSEVIDFDIIKDFTDTEILKRPFYNLEEDQNYPERERIVYLKSIFNKLIENERMLRQHGLNEIEMYEVSDLIREERKMLPIRKREYILREIKMKTKYNINLVEYGNGIL